MAASLLDLSHPCFLAFLGSLQHDPDTQEALAQIKTKIEVEHTSCNRVVQKFYGNAKFPHLHGKIWKYDWGKSSASGRKSWRLVVVVPEPDVQPYRLIAGAIYAKNVSEQLSLRELASIFSCVMTPSSAADSDTPTPESTFHRVPNGDNQTRSICLLCYTPVAVSIDLAVLDKAELEHRCDLAPADPK
jgi:hypothetical protein